MIEEIEIDGYRLLHGFKADLKALNVIVGANATGKSSLIDCLQLISYCCRLPISAAFGQFDHPAEVKALMQHLGLKEIDKSKCPVDFNKPVRYPTLAEKKRRVERAAAADALVAAKGGYQTVYESLVPKRPAPSAFST